MYCEDYQGAGVFCSKGLNKRKDCEKIGVKLFHVWEDDWLEDEHSVKEEIVESLTAAKQ